MSKKNLLTIIYKHLLEEIHTNESLFEILVNEADTGEEDVREVIAEVLEEAEAKIKTLMK